MQCSPIAGTQVLPALRPPAAHSNSREGLSGPGHVTPGIHPPTVWSSDRTSRFPSRTQLIQMPGASPTPAVPAPGGQAKVESGQCQDSAPWPDGGALEVIFSWGGQGDGGGPRRLLRDAHLWGSQLPVSPGVALSKGEEMRWGAGGSWGRDFDNPSN